MALACGPKPYPVDYLVLSAREASVPVMWTGGDVKPLGLKDPMFLPPPVSFLRRERSLWYFRPETGVRLAGEPSLERRWSYLNNFRFFERRSSVYLKDIWVFQGVLQETPNYVDVGVSVIYTEEAGR